MNNESDDFGIPKWMGYGVPIGIVILILCIAAFAPAFTKMRTSGPRSPTPSREVMELLEELLEEIRNNSTGTLPINSSEMKKAISQWSGGFLITREITSYRDISENVVWIDINTRNNDPIRIVYQLLPNNQYKLSLISTEAQTESKHGP